jgi:hypothetical protein
VGVTRVKLLFRLAQDENGFPPFAMESMWAVRRGNGYEIDSIPFYACAVALGDVVAAEERHGGLWYVRTVQASRNSLIRVVAFAGAGLESIRRELDSLGCSTEVDSDRHLVAVSIPQEVPLGSVQAVLEERHRQGMLDYEEPILRQ